MKHNLRSRITGRFIPAHETLVLPEKIVNGRLYKWRDTIVRARYSGNSTNMTGARYVTCHKTLGGWVKDSELSLIPKDQVEKYLKNA